MRKRLLCAVVLTAMLLIAALPSSAAAQFIPAPQTGYATDFVSKCEGQQWFLNEIERLLNLHQSSINTLSAASDLDCITSLGLAGKGIFGSVPTAVGELRELRHLFLADNRLSGALPEALFALPKLENIDLSRNYYTGDIPAQFGAMPSLTTLMLRGNSYTGTIPRQILANPHITTLDVAQNQLSGGLPAELANMTALQYLGVAGNPWGGSLPDLTGLTQLKTLSAWNCGLRGMIPSSLYTLSSLQVLDLAGNRLSGEIGAEMGGLHRLQLLSLSGNELEGQLPATLSALTQLQRLDVSDNRLNGLVPDVFGGMTKLEQLHLERNKLRGHLPASIETRLHGGTVVHASDNYLTGPILAQVTDHARNFCDGATSDQYRIVAPSPVTISEQQASDIFALVRNRDLRTGGTWLKPLLPIDCYSASIINDPDRKVSITRDSAGIYVQVVPLPPPSDPSQPVVPREIPLAENIRVVLLLTDNTGSPYSTIEIVLTTETVPTGGGGGGGGGGGAQPPTEPSAVLHTPYVDGFPDGTFGAGLPITREQAAKLVVSALGVEVSASSYRRFPDVPTDRWSAPYIEYAQRQSYLQGMGDGTFHPADSMTRAEFATCLVRIWGNRGQLEGQTPTFTDVPADAWYTDYVRQAAAAGLVQGGGDGTFRPLAPITRAEAVTIINRLLSRIPSTASVLPTLTCPFSDLAPSHWAYLDIIEASLEHQHERMGNQT